MANSVEVLIRMDMRMDNTEPSVMMNNHYGVCNEYGPPAKAMMYSGLTSNRKSVAEMTTPDKSIEVCRVTKTYEAAWSIGVLFGYLIWLSYLEEYILFCRFYRIIKTG